MTGLAAGYAIGIVGDAVSLHLRLNEPLDSRAELILLKPNSFKPLIPLVVRPSISIRIKSFRIDGFDPHFRVSLALLLLVYQVAILTPSSHSQ